MLSLVVMAVGASIGRAAAFGSSAAEPIPQPIRSLAVPIMTALEIDIGMTVASLPGLCALMKRIKGRGIVELNSNDDLQLRSDPKQKPQNTQSKTVNTVYHYPLREEIRLQVGMAEGGFSQSICKIMVQWIV